MSGELTPEAKTEIKLMLTDLKVEMKNEIAKEQGKYNTMISEMHQEIMGYGKRKGVIEKQIEYECRIEDHEIRITAVEKNQTGKIETRKAIIAAVGIVVVAIIGSGVWQFIF